MKPSRFGDQRRSWVRSSLICAAVIFASTNRVAAQEDLSSEPFTVFVAIEKAFARCGPSNQYYRTDALRHGQQLEVYLETDDGWLGVRPPESSFCWLPVSAVEIATGGETATVVEDRTVSWIGTHLGRARQYRWQVQMAEGEQVTILGRSDRDGPDGPQTWLRIVPPSGEFRWIHRDLVAESAEELVASLRKKSTPDQEPVVVQQPSPRKRAEPESGLDAIVQTANSIKKRLAGNDSIGGPGAPTTPPLPATAPLPAATLAVTNEIPQLKQAPQTPQQPQNSSVARNVVGSGLQQPLNTAAQPATTSQAGMAANAAPAPAAPPVADASVAASTEFIGRPRLLDIGSGTSAPQNNVAAADSNWVVGVGRMAAENRGGIQPAAFTQRTRQAATQSTTVPAENIHRVATEVRDADVDKLQLLLSRLMARGASAAETEPVVARARNLSLTAHDQVVAGRARLVAERAEQYQRVARRRDGSTVIRENGIPVIPAGGTLPAAAARLPAITPAASGGDMHTGFLVQVYSSRPNSPPFALTDHAGNTTAYVTPTPGINLRGHLNSHVKVIGRRGFLRGLNMPHFVVAQAVRTPE